MSGHGQFAANSLRSCNADPTPGHVGDPDLERELLRAMTDFDDGDYVEITVEQLENCAATGESPWPDESHA